MRSGALWAVVGLVGVLLIVPPLIMGFGIERLHTQLIQEAGSQSDAAYTIEGRLDRGWFVSKAETIIRYRSETDSQIFELALNHDIVHGPIPLGELFFGRSPLRLVAAVVDTRYEADATRLSHFADALDGRPLLQVLAWLRFDRSASLRLLSPEFGLHDGRFVSRGVDGYADLDPAAETMRSQVRFGPFVIVGDAGEIRIAESRLQFESTPGEQGNTMSGRLELGELTLRGAVATSRVEPSRLDWSALLADQELVEGAAELVVGEYRVEGADETTGMLRLLSGLRVDERMQYAPETGLRGFELELRFDRLEGDRRFDSGEMKFLVRNIDTAAIQGFRAAMARIEAQGLPEIESNLKKAGALEEWGPQVLGPSPELALEKLSFDTDAGPVRADFRLGIDAADPSMLGNPFMVMALIQAELNLKMPSVVLNELLDDHHFCKAPMRSVKEVDPESGEESTRRVAAQAPFPAPVMQRLWDGYRVDRSAVDSPQADVDGILQAAGFSCQPIVVKMVSDGILLEGDGSLEASVRVRETLPFVNGVPRPELLIGIAPDL
ncbi:MAG: DUF945 family protein [Deltaproteobacteria bacterium]|nr:DUF945 family protein [Deltaproteobacteria bacterium]MBW2383102.1 DUF945 family protein [Deltaproteobacteria bacterium]MBW2698786.1 DUF945 family protein [Deltaproteobacteria bacterium]